ncbi:MAG: MFS transporter [Acidimicrobiales bacterium]
MISISMRIERLPFYSFHRRLLLIGGLGYTFAAMELAVIAFVLPVLKVRWGLNSFEVGLLGSSPLIGYFFGAFSAGMMGDLIGRRVIMMWALSIYCAAAFGSALVHSWQAFFIFRIVAGVGGGAESAIVAPYLSEFVARQYRGRFTGSLAGFFSFGFVAAALLGYFVVPPLHNGWRYVIIITALPVLMLLWWRRALPESPRWLDCRARVGEAEAVLDKMEREFQNRVGPLPAFPPEDVVPPRTMQQGTFSSNFLALWSKKLARITAMSWILFLTITFTYYAFFTWIPTLLVENGLTITKSFSYSIAIYLAQIPGYYAAAWINDKVGRQLSISCFLILGGVSAIAMTMSHAGTTVLIAGIFMSFFMNGTYAGVYTYISEVFPTELRGSGFGVASSIGRIGGAASPIIVGLIFPVYGFAGVFGLSAVSLIVGALAVMLLGVPTLNRSLEEIAAGQ